jgi:hypothetical protein
MPVFAALLIVASVAAGTDDSGGRGVEVVTARVQVAILEPAGVRQGSGHERVSDRPVPQITRRAGEILVEFQ